MPGFVLSSSDKRQCVVVARWVATIPCHRITPTLTVHHSEVEILEPVRKALETVERHADKILQRWYSTYTNARMEGLNSLFQAARARAK